MSYERLYIKEGWNTSKYHYYLCLAKHYSSNLLEKPYILLVKGSQKARNIWKILEKLVLKRRELEWSYPYFNEIISVYKLTEEETKYFLRLATIFRKRETERKIWKELSQLDGEELKKRIDVEYMRIKIGGK